MESIVNRTARANYELLDSYEAGIVLTGAEVKSIKLGRVKLQGSYVTLEGGRLVIKQMHISPYQQANQPHYDPERERWLLLSKSELIYISQQLETAGLTMVPVKLYSKGGLIKLNIAIARGLKKYDKRHKLKQRAIDRDTDRLLKSKR